MKICNSPLHANGFAIEGPYNSLIHELD
jgi:hypothetical protein